MTGAVVILRALEAGITITELDDMPMGLLMDILTEKMNDQVEFPYKATQADINRL